MESFYGRDIGYKSNDLEELHHQHLLFTICVLRDHIRVCTQFLVASRLLEKESVLIGERLDIQAQVVHDLQRLVNQYPCLYIRFYSDSVEVKLDYALLKKSSYFEFKIPREEVAERYSVR